MKTFAAIYRGSSAHRVRGVGLVELMIAMLLGALVVVAVIQIFSANKQTFRMQDAMSMTQEGGTYALDFIARDLLRAGFPGYPTATQAFDRLNTLNDVVTAAGTNDTLAVVYAPQVSGDTFCTGESVGAATLISNRYWVERNDDTGINELRCRGAVANAAGGFDLTGTAQVLVDNVESFQVLYGVDLEHNRDPASLVGCQVSAAQPTAYITAAQLQAAIDNGGTPLTPPAVSPPPPPPNCAAMNEMQVIRSVRIALLLRTPNDAGAVVPAGLTYTVLEQIVPQPVPADGRLRRLFTKTVALRNVEEIL